MSPPSSLAEQAALIQSVIQASGGSLRPPPEILAVSLAQFFDYNVTKGGFAQLIYNSRGEYLQEIEQMLGLANASVAGAFYERAIRLCVDSRGEFGPFLDNSFATEGPLKNALHLLSVEYFREAPQFAKEIEAFVEASAERVLVWVRSTGERDG